MKRPSTGVLLFSLALSILCATVAFSLLGLLGGGLDIQAEASPPSDCSVSTGNVTVKDLDADQSRNAGTIVSEGRKAGVPRRGWVVATAVAFVESGVRNLASLAYPDSLNYPHDGVASGDNDSVGIMQQRASWGSMAQRMTVPWSVRHFYQGGSTAPDGWEEPGLLDTPGWQNMSITVAAQTVQVSQYPDAYAAYADEAAQVVAQVTGQQVVHGCTNDGDQAADVNGPWAVPLADGYYNSAGFGECSGLWAACHTGYDMAGIPEGTDIYAAHTGTVESVTYESGSYGWFTILSHGRTHGQTLETAYAHQMSRPDLRVGETVKVGDVIGHVGQTGNTTGVHLHFEVRIGGEPVDPVPFMQAHKAPL